MQVQIVVLLTKGDTKQSRIELADGSEDEVPQRIAKVLRKTKLPQKIHTWDYAKMKLELWGYKEGRQGTENKHEFPPPIDSSTLFGDAVMVATMEGGDPTNITTAQYTKFYTQIFQGFDSQDEDDDSSEADEEADEESVVDEVIEEEEEIEEVEEEVEEEEEVKPAPKREYNSSRNKKIPKWAMAVELETEEYIH
jgi:hypothetical protein